MSNTKFSTRTKFIGFFLLLLISSVFAFQNCTETPYNIKAVPSNTENPDAYNGPIEETGVPVDPNTLTKHTLNFSISSSATISSNMVDILFVIDNSGSMSDEQQLLQKALANFINTINVLDWRIGIITTDMTDDTEIFLTTTYYGSDHSNYSSVPAKGHLIPLKNSTSTFFSNPKKYFITKGDDSISNLTNIFSDSIYLGDQGSGAELGLQAIDSFLNFTQNSNLSESTFLRPGASFVTIVISDENSYGDDSTPNKNLINFYSTLYTKIVTQFNLNFQSHSFVLSKSYTQNSLNNSLYCTPSGDHEQLGLGYIEISKQTGGVIAPICAADYSDYLTNIGQGIIIHANSAASKLIKCIPQDFNGDGKPDLALINADTKSPIQYNLSINGDKVIFDPPINTPGNYTIEYYCR